MSLPWVFHPLLILLATYYQEKAPAEIRGEFVRTKSWVNFAGDFWWTFSGPFSLENNRRKESTQKSTAKFKSEFGSFVAKIHAARTRPWLIRAGFSQNGYSRISILSRRICFPNFVGFFCSLGKSAQINSSGKSPAKILQNLYNRNPRHISADRLGQNLTTVRQFMREIFPSPLDFSGL